ncbi:MAG TPA: PAS domain S-box protein [Nocardioidaceae bacterium]|nr:PAS domain S-box protein [Nocardioidaceae bacterium]
MTGDRHLSPSESVIATLARSSEDAVIVQDLDGTVEEWNEAASAVYGHMAEDILGRNINVLIPSETRAVERVVHKDVASGKAVSRRRCTRVSASGSAVQVDVSMAPVLDKDGHAIGVASISRPVRDVEITAARFAALLDAAPDAMIFVDRTGRIVLVNAQAGTLFGYDRQELVGAEMEVLLPDGLRQRHRGHRADFVRQPEPRPMGSGLLLRARRRDGSTFPVEISLATHELDGESLVIAAVRDVSAQRAIEAEVRESETRLRQLAEHVDTVFTLRQIEPHRYLYVSPAFVGLTGHDSAELVEDAALLAALVHPDDRDRVVADYIERSNAGLLADCEFRIIRKDEEIRWVRAVSTPVASDHGDPERLVTAMEDITDRVLAAQFLQDAESSARGANAAKNDFLSRMSHELRTPLNAVLGFGQILELRLQGTEHAQAVAHVLRAGRHLLALINEILDTSRIEAGELSVSAEPVPVLAVVDEASLLMKPLAETAEVTLSVAGGPAGLYVLADRQRLRQIMLNLISNALKYNHPGGSVRLSWAADLDEVSIAVSDTGRGIAPELHSRLFTAFDRLGAEGSGIEGVGVGLAVTRALTELMNGRIEVQSEVGLGSDFTVILPIAKGMVSPSPGSTLHPPPHRQPETGRSSVMLYIEDNEPNVRVMESVLGLRPQWRLIHAALGSLGLELARAHLPDLVMLDLHLPDAFGADILAALKSDPATAAIPVVVLSADASPHRIRKLLEDGALRYLTKPLEIDGVIELVDEVAAGPRVPPPVAP